MSSTLPSHQTKVFKSLSSSKIIGTHPHGGISYQPDAVPEEPGQHNGCDHDFDVFASHNVVPEVLIVVVNETLAPEKLLVTVAESAATVSSNP